MYVGGVDGRAVRFMTCDVVEELLAAPGASISRVTAAVVGEGEVALDVAGRVPALGPEHFVGEQPFHGTSSDLLSLTILAAMSRRLDAAVSQEGTAWRQSFSAGVPLAPPERAAGAGADAVSLRFSVDPAVFRDVRVPFLTLCGRFQEIAVFHPACVFRVEDRTGPGVARDYHYPLGLRSYVEELDYDWLGFSDYGQVWKLELWEGTDRARAVIHHRGFGRYAMHSFVNGLRTRDGGSHVDGFERAFREALAGEAGEPVRRYGWEEDPFYGLTVLLAVDMAEPSYAGATKDQLAGDRPRVLVSSMVATQLPARWAMGSAT